LIIFLCTNYNQHLIDFAKTIDFCEVKIIIDNNENIFSDPIIFQIEDKNCIDLGYKNTVTEKGMMTHVNKNPNSWDKCMYFLCEKNIEKCLILEEDVFIPKLETLKRLLSYKYDLLIPRIELREKMYNNWNWNIIETKIDPPYYYSLVCAVGLSKNMIECIKEYKNQNGFLFNHEVMLPTLARQNELTFFVPIELSGIVAYAEWDISLFNLYPDYLFHPVKNIKFHNEIRNYIEDKNNSCMPTSITSIYPQYYKKLRIPSFLKFNKAYSKYNIY
jgi:hypothetical protein